MSRELIEKMARAFWDAELPEPDRGHKWVPRQGAFVMAWPVRWDDTDMHESDRELYRKKTRAILSLLSDPANITDEMVQAAKFTLRLSSYSDPLQHPNMLRLIIAAAFSEPS